MIRFSFYLLVILLALGNSGCALLYSFDDNLNEKIDNWLKDEEYGKASDALTYIRESHPQYAQLQNKKAIVEKRAKLYEQQQLAAIQSHMQKHEWQQAHEVVSTALKKLPDSEPLRDARQDFLQKRALYLNKLHIHQSIYKAEWLIKNKQVQEELIAATPEDTTARRNYRRYTRQVEDSYLEMVECGEECTESGELELAERCFSLANNLQPGQALQSRLNALQDKLAGQKENRKDELTRQGQNILSEAKKQMQAGDLKKAIAEFSKLSIKDKNHSQSKSFKKELDTRVHEHVKQNIELGRKLYSQGEIKQALAIWNDIRELDPDNEYLISHIERAQRVLDKVNKLQEEPTISPPPEKKQNH